MFLLALTMNVYVHGAVAAPVLESYLDRARLLVVTAPSEGDAELRRQLDEMGRDKAGLADRDLVIIRVIGSNAYDDRGSTIDAAALRDALQLPVQRFMAVLVGKDGGVKLRSNTAIATDELFRTIDAMPMRRGEMRRKR